MKRKKLRSYVIPTLYVIILMLVFGTVSLVSSLMNENQKYFFATSIMNTDTRPVMEDVGEISPEIVRPYTSEDVSIDKYFYDVNDPEDKQTNSLIYFQNTYMKNTGVLYKAKEAFDVVSVLSGTVVSVKDDEILGKVIEVSHNTNLTTIYYSLSEITVKEGDMLVGGQKLGKSGGNNISKEGNYLLFEVNYNGTLINPELFYDMDISKLN